MGSILLNKKIIQRSREITEETALLLNLIESHQPEFGERARRLMGQMRIERNFEMDAGLASMVTSPGFTRRDGDMKSYTQLMPQFSSRYWQYMIRNVEFLAHPQMQPYETVLHRLQLVTGIDFSAHIKNDTKSFIESKLDRAKVGTKVPLTDAETKVLKKIVNEYLNRPRLVIETGTAQDWLTEFVKNLDQRIKDLDSSLSDFDFGSASMISASKVN